MNQKNILKIFLITMVALTFICSFMPYSEAHILIIGDSNNDIPQSYNEALSIANFLKSKGYSVVELYKENATTKSILKGMYGADAIIYAGHGGYETGNYNLNGGSATSPFALVGSNDFIWGIGNQMREGWNGQLFTAPVKQNIPVILLQACFSTGWVDDKQVSNPISTIYNFAKMFRGIGANYYATAWDGAGLDLVKKFFNGAKNFSQVNKQSAYEKIAKSNIYKNTAVWRNSNGYSAFVGNWLGQFPTVMQTTEYNDSAAEAWYDGDRSKNPFQSDLIVSEVTAPKKAYSGSKIYVSNTIKNIVNVNSSSFYVNYYLKKSLTSTNIYIGKSFIETINGLASKHQTTTLQLPTKISPGSYYILATADAYQTVPETNEKNNVKISSSKVTVKTSYHDLIITEISAKLKGVRTLVVYNTIKNTGIHATKSYYVNYYIKKKNSKQKKYIGKYHYSGLGSGSTRYKKITITLSKSIKASNYYVAAYVDTHKTVSESNETNNYKTGPINSV
ncbi:MAG TPA: CARDB domain-containing protein [Methanobacterium sp.]